MKKRSVAKRLTPFQKKVLRQMMDGIFRSSEIASNLNASEEWVSRAMEKIDAMKSKGKDRIVKALNSGWGFSDLFFNDNSVQRHSLWARRPGQEGWQCHKVNADIGKDDYVDALLDEAGVP